MSQQMTYISLFSGAGVGCYGFKMENFQCVATNEIIPRRLDIQRFNHKCKYETGYICGDIASERTKELLRAELLRWQTVEHCQELDVLIATPPCQGMSVANHKKSSTEIVRNSLAVESMKLIKEFRPRVFLFENVPSFMRTICTDIDGRDKPISEAFLSNLGPEYSYAARIINFKDYGACSSRSRTLVIGVRNDIADDVSPYELFPVRQKERTLREVIGELPPLTAIGEITPQDIYHSFRSYPAHMRSWISPLGEGESAFDNADPLLRPHQVKNGKIIENQRKNGDKYRRQFWDRTGPCVHTRNDQLASQNTIHPSDDRVFSIRELMLMMTIPSDFQWSRHSLEALNRLPDAEKRSFLKQEEIKIRQSLGEGVPTEVFRSIAANIRGALFRRRLTPREIDAVLKSEAFATFDGMLGYLRENPDNLSFSTLVRLAERANAKRTENAAYYTNQFIITDILKSLPETAKPSVRILEPSVGVGSFLPLILKRFDAKDVTIDAVDIDPASIEIARVLLTHIRLPETAHINFICGDFLLHSFSGAYDYAIGNPPFGKIPSSSKKLRLYKDGAINTETNNICSYFLDKCVKLSSVAALVLPKAVLNIPEFAPTRRYLQKKSVSAILDFGEKGFQGVLVETVALVVEAGKKPYRTTVTSIPENITVEQRQNYICAGELPYWIIYRDSFFDRIAAGLQLNAFTVFRDRQITNSLLSDSGEIPVIKARNLNNAGTGIQSVPGYDSFVRPEDVRELAVYQFLDDDSVYLTPNMTYNPRVVPKPKHTLVNGSVAILIPREGIVPTRQQLLYFSSDEYRAFYRIARNHQTRSLNVDACSVYFYGLKKEAKPVAWLTENDIRSAFSGKNLDIRTTHNARWIDQKCTPDVLCIVSDCIENYAAAHGSAPFSSVDVWHDSYTVENVEHIFSKPGLTLQTARNEYDKYFQQPMELLAAAGVLYKSKRGNRNFYSVASPELLSYIAMRERNALTFLQLYIERVLTDSGLIGDFEAFYRLQTPEAYDAVKTRFEDFTIMHTPINGRTECRRIFTKIINPLAFKRRSLGTEKGRLSRHPITYDVLMYNRDNFRDLYSRKPKGMTRSEYAASIGAEPNASYSIYQSAKAKRLLRAYNDRYRCGRSEVTTGPDSTSLAVHMHHIFPETRFPDIAAHLENLIALSPTQHLGCAHPLGNTKVIDPDYQRVCLLAKAASIQENLNGPENAAIYEFRRFLYVLAVGFSCDEFEEIADMDFDAVTAKIRQQYGAPKR